MTVWHKASSVLGLLLVTLGASWASSPIIALAGVPLMILGMFFAMFACAGFASTGASERKPLVGVLAAMGVLGVAYGAICGAGAFATYYLNLGRQLPTSLGENVLIALLVGATGATVTVWALANIRKCLLQELWRVWLYWFAYTLLAMGITWFRGANGAPFSA